MQLPLECQHSREAIPLIWVWSLPLFGAVIVYQIHHLPEYATLKAMGLIAISSLVVFQSLILAVMGFVPGEAAHETPYC